MFVLVKRSVCELAIELKNEVLSLFLLHFGYKSGNFGFLLVHLLVQLD